MPNGSIKDSLKRFENAARLHHRLQNPAEGIFEVGAVNAEAASIAKAFKELSLFGNRGRDALLTLLIHPDKAVVAMAAAYSPGYATTTALASLEQLVDEPGRIGLGAELTIHNWHNGAWNLHEQYPNDSGGNNELDS